MIIIENAHLNAALREHDYEAFMQSHFTIAAQADQATAFSHLTHLISGEWSTKSAAGRETTEQLGSILQRFKLMTALLDTMENGDSIQHMLLPDQTTSQIGQTFVRQESQ
ncbi:MULTISPECIES: hypothetical protein [unclassified Xanthomonas]|uniref:hypothetical protein n=1 Tax=unclassified Xanthomonas TaxID=2643310 RepID=UPI0028830C4B|nr:MULTISPECIES: hypothetical protein [unclassified Xanthomonas]